MKLLTFCLASVTWALVSLLVDCWLHNFGFALILGGLVALIVVCAISAVRAARLADEFEREELRHIAEEIDKTR